MDNNYGFEDRTRFTPDNEREYKKPTKRDRTDEYWNLFDELLKAVGLSKQLEALAQNYGKGQTRVDAVVDEYAKKNLTLSKREVLDGYISKCEEYRDLSRRLLVKFMNLCHEIGLDFDYDVDEYYRWLSDKDVRDCHYRTVAYGRKKHLILPPSEIDARYERLLEHRAKKAQK